MNNCRFTLVFDFCFVTVVYGFIWKEFQDDIDLYLDKTEILDSSMVNISIANKGSKKVKLHKLEPKTNKLSK